MHQLNNTAIKRKSEYIAKTLYIQNLHRPRRYNLKALSLDFLELLERFIPTEYEMKLIHNYECEGRPLDELSEEDRFMVRFSKIPRLSQRISTLTFMGNFPESVQLIQPVSPRLNCI